jgi:polyisoprenoid-binding protein YceI
MRPRFAALLAIVLFATSAPAQKEGKQTKFPLSGENTRIEFVGYKPGGKHEGGFKELTGSATVNGNDPTTMKLRVEIDTTSLYSDDKKLTGHLKAPDFFNVKKYPKAEFVSSKVEKTPTGYAIAGELTLLGKSKPVSIPARITLTDKGLSLTASFKIDRTDWGMTYGKGKIDDEVALTVSVDVKR